LPEREREVLALAYWSGLSQSEVAEFLGIPLGTVKTRTRAALTKLSEILGDELQ
jgi:RNA polymerase sigma-70 factor (ECF subfamily)